MCMITSEGERPNLDISEVNFRKVNAAELSALVKKAIPEGVKGLKEKWEFRGGRWDRVDSKEIVMSGASVTEDGRCKIAYIEQANDTAVYNLFGQNSEFGSELIRRGTLAIQIRNRSNGNIPTIRRFYAVADEK